VAEVLHVFVSQVHRFPMRQVREVRAVVNRGFEGCNHARPGGRRQVLLMDIETLAELGLAAGTVKENITTRGLRLAELKLGQRLRVGEAVLEVTVPCEPCGRMDEVRPGLQEQLRGRRGMLCRVVEGGLVRSGDGIELVELAEEES